jgi:hypothetical protein
MANSKALSNGAVHLGFEADLWRAADALRSNMDAAEYKHVVLGLIFLKYISDVFEEKHRDLAARQASDYTDPEDPDEYRAVNIFWVPQEARWSFLQANAKQPTIGKLVDEAMVAIERDNPSLKGVLPKDYAHPRLDKQRLGQLIDMVGNIGLGDRENRSKDILGRVYEYFLSQFASAEGKNPADRRRLPCLSRGPGCRGGGGTPPLRRRPRFLQGREVGGDSPARPHPDPGALRRRGRGGGQRRAVRGEDGAAGGGVAGTAGGGGQAGCRHRRQFEGAGVWTIGAMNRTTTCFAGRKRFCTAN